MILLSDTNVSIAAIVITIKFAIIFEKTRYTAVNLVKVEKMLYIIDTSIDGKQ